MSAALLFVRLVLGLGMAAHGSQKLFGWFGGHGIAGTGGFFEGLGFRPGPAFAIAAGLGEFLGGLLTAFGLGGAFGPVLIVAVMLVAIISVHLTKGFFAEQGGWELAGLYVAGAVAVAFAGSGAYSLDRLFGISFLTSEVHVGYAMGVAVVLAAASLLARRPKVAPAP